MTDIGLRDLGTVVPGAAQSEPAAPAVPAPPANLDAAQSRQNRSIFAADLPRGEDALGLEPTLALLAELAAHTATELPISIGILGGPGSGKSFALTKLLGSIKALSFAAEEVKHSPFLSKIFALRVDAASLAGEPANALAVALYAGLVPSFPDLAQEAAHAVRDPHVVAQESASKLDEARRKLDSERRRLEEIEGRRARLSETVLYETAGSLVDTYSRANRARIERSFSGFGLTGDPILGFKNAVRDIAEVGGPNARLGAGLRAFWAFKGQIRLIVVAVLLLFVGMGLGALIASQNSWLGWLRSSHESMLPVANWLAAHVAWISTLRSLVFAGAGLSVLMNLWRGSRFLLPLLRGVSFLETDLANRRRDLDGLYAHQTRRVDSLANEVEMAAHRAAEADRRARGFNRIAAAAQPEHVLFASEPSKMQAQSFFSALGALISRRGQIDGQGQANSVEAPQRIVLALDNLDALAPARAREILEQAHRALVEGNLVTLIAVDPERLTGTSGDSLATLERWIQVPFWIGKTAERTDYASLVHQLIGHGIEKPKKPLTTIVDPRQSLLDRPLSGAEAKLLAALAPIAGRSPRAVKRFVNLYRIARFQAEDDPAALALMLAIDLGGTQAEIEAVLAALADAPAGGDLDIEHAGPRLGEALEALQTVTGKPTVEAVCRAAAVARAFSLRA